MEKNNGYYWPQPPADSLHESVSSEVMIESLEFPHHLSADARVRSFLIAQQLRAAAKALPDEDDFDDTDDELYSPHELAEARRLAPSGQPAPTMRAKPSPAGPKVTSPSDDMDEEEIDLRLKKSELKRKKAATAAQNEGVS